MGFFGSVCTAVCSLVVIFLGYLLARSLKNNRKWAKLGVPHWKPVPLFGNNWKLFTRQVSIGQHLKNLADSFPNAPIIGWHDFINTKLIVRDPELIERILVKDFNHFTDHGFPLNDSIPLDHNLFMLAGDKWRAFRQKFVPMFTTGKLRGMTHQISDISMKIIDIIGSGGQEGVNMKDVLERFTMDVIGSTAFGIDTRSMEDASGEFRQMGLKIFNPSRLQFFKQLIISTFPFLYTKLGIPINMTDVQMYFAKILSDTMKYRKENNIVRNDFLQMFMTLKEKGKLEVNKRTREDDYLGIDNEGLITQEYELTDDLILGHSFVFLTAGFESTALTILYTCYELARHPEIQEIARNEVKACVPDKSGYIDYDSLKKMNYLSNCIKESMRTFSVNSIIFRVCTKDYPLPGCSYVIKAGDPVWIPVTHLHDNPNLHPNPEQFIPDRFNEELPKFSYMPFGDGPRICIAMRFAQLEVRCSMARLLLNYRLTLNPKTKLPIEIDTNNFFTAPKSPILFDLTPLE